jgi:hypothetical protein
MDDDAPAGGRGFPRMRKDGGERQRDTRRERIARRKEKRRD